MTREEAIRLIGWLKCTTNREDDLEAIDMAIEALSESNVHNSHSGDLISREDAIALLTKIVFDEPPYFDSETLCRLYAEEQINTLPSAESQPIVATHFDIQSGYIYCSPQIAENVKVVVRCKDCRFRKKIGTLYYCDLDEYNVKDADFCSWGERREK